MFKALFKTLGIVGGLTFAPAVEAASQQMPRPVIIVSCPTPSPYSLKLCQAMIQPLSELAPSHIIRIGTAEAALRPEDMRATLTLTDESAYGLEAQLQWQSGLTPDPVTGPALRVDVMDAETFPQSMIEHFAQNLLRSTPPPL